MGLVEFLGQSLHYFLTKKEKEVVIKILGSQVMLIAKERITFQATSAARRSNSYLEYILLYSKGIGSSPPKKNRKPHKKKLQ